MICRPPSTRPRTPRAGARVQRRSSRARAGCGPSRGLREPAQHRPGLKTTARRLPPRTFPRRPLRRRPVPSRSRAQSRRCASRRGQCGRSRSAAGHSPTSALGPPLLQYFSPCTFSSFSGPNGSPSVEGVGGDPFNGDAERQNSSGWTAA